MRLITIATCVRKLDTNFHSYKVKLRLPLLSGATTARLDVGSRGGRLWTAPESGTLNSGSGLAMMCHCVGKIRRCR